MILMPTLGNPRDRANRLELPSWSQGRPSSRWRIALRSRGSGLHRPEQARDVRDLDEILRSHLHWTRDAPSVQGKSDTKPALRARSSALTRSSERARWEARRVPRPWPWQERAMSRPRAAHLDCRTPPCVRTTKILGPPDREGRLCSRNGQLASWESWRAVQARCWTRKPT